MKKTEYTKDFKDQTIKYVLESVNSGRYTIVNRMDEMNLQDMSSELRQWINTAMDWLVV